MTTGQKIRMLRKKLGMTQEDLAHKIGYKSKTSITHIEQNRDKSLEIIQNIAKALNTTPQYLAGWELDPEKKRYLFDNIDKLTDEQFDALLSEFEKLKAQNSKNKSNSK